MCILTWKRASRHKMACTFSTSQLQKVVRTWCALYILTSKCASRHNGVHFFDISTSESAPTLVCFVHFDLETCFAPQNGVHFFDISTSKSVHFSSLLWPDCSAPAALASLLFDPPQPQITGKHRESRLSYLFAHLHLLSSDSFSSLIFSLLLFSSLTLPTSAFPSVHTVGSLSSKLPSIVS